MRVVKDICGTIDERIRFQVLHAMKQKSTTSPRAKAPSSPLSPLRSVGSLLSTLLPRQGNDNVPVGGASSQRDETNAEAVDMASGVDDDDDLDLPPLVTSDTEANSDFLSDEAILNADGSTTISELPSITRGAWPWLAAVYVNNLTSLAYQCGGTLISSRIVISAAHCFQLFKKRFTANEVLVFLGRHNLKNWNEEGSIAAPVDDIFIHPDYNEHLSSYDADIAVVVLKNEVRYISFSKKRWNK